MLYRAEPGDALRDQVDYDKIQTLDKQISQYGSYFYCVNTDTGVKIGYSAAGWGKNKANPGRIIFYRRMYPVSSKLAPVLDIHGIPA